jgi:O-acetyl-ADP-ribose deacetylase (regulator of RNase III)
MIQYAKGDIFDCKADALANPVNCAGVMGKGLALLFRQRFPGNFNFYKRACQIDQTVKPGKVLVFANPGCPAIVNFPTKRHWRDASRLEGIEAGLADLVSVMPAFEIESMAVPPLGCGLGGLDWPKVRRLMEEAFARLPDRQFTIIEQ